MTTDISIDFDFFTREQPEWDFGHREDFRPAMQDTIWHTRYGLIDLYSETDIARYADLRPDKLFLELAKRGLDFREGEKRRVMCADSHEHAYDFFWRSKARRLVNIDAHHDCWTATNGRRVKCDNWLTMLRYERANREYTSVYPKWKDIEADGPPQPLIGSPVRRPAGVRLVQWRNWAPVSDVVGDIFICRSPAWVPPHHDTQFQRMCETFIALSGEVIEPVPMAFRTYPSPEEAAKLREEVAQQLRTLHERG